MKRAYKLTKQRNPCVHKREDAPNLVLVKFRPAPEPTKRRYKTASGNVWNLVKNADGTWDYVAIKP